MTNIISIILLIVSGAVFFLFINPTYVGKEDGKEDGIKQLLAKEKKIREKTSNLAKIDQKRKELKKQYTALKSANADAIERLEKMIPNDMENARLINYIHSIKSNSNSTQISDIKIDRGNKNQSQNNRGKISIKKNKNYNSVNLLFSFESQYSSFVKFLDDLYKSLRLVDVVSINITPSKKNKEQTQDLFKFNIKIRTYWLNK